MTTTPATGRPDGRGPVTESAEPGEATSAVEAPAAADPASGPRPRSGRVPDLIGLLARLVLGGIMLTAGFLKIGTPEASANAVRAYQVIPYDAAALVGYALPVVEIILGILLVLGLFTRVSAVITSLLLVAFIAGIAQAWARGLSIDCGCFGGGGQVGANQTEYPQRIAEDVGMLLCGLWLAWRPRSLVSMDRLLLRR